MDAAECLREVELEAERNSLEGGLMSALNATIFMLMNTEDTTSSDVGKPPVPIPVWLRPTPVGYVGHAEVQDSPEDSDGYS